MFALISWTLAATVFPADVPGLAASSYWVTAIAGALLFYVCLLAHEMAHALVARRSGVAVAGITLWLFGGVSQLSGEPKSARSEALIAIVGPLTSFGVALVALVVALATTSNALLSDLFLWLAYVNVALGVFNLVPAFPLDGGRVLSAFFWWRSGSRQRGVHNAVRIGRVFAYLMIAIGVLELFTGGVANGIWLAFLGWFLLSAASSEEAGVTVKTLLRSVPASAAMSSPVVTVPDWITVEQFITGVAPNHPFTTYPVHDPAGKLTGVVRLPDLVRVPRDDQATARLIEFANPIGSVPVTWPEEELATMIQRLGGTIDQRVLVFNQGELAGIISPSDIARLLTIRQSQAGSRKP